MRSEKLDRHALGKRLTWLANAREADLVALPVRDDAKIVRARRIGLTGAPGAGKSTLLGHLAIERAAKGPIGVLAVDPSSPRTGGAVLGDRIRMDELAGSANLYIRSLGSRSASDGLADNLPEMLDALDEFGFAEVMLETVGVGQAEYAARAQVDTLVLVLLPDSGDAVQAMKAGIMEMADIFVVNKSDLSGAQKMASDMKRIAAIGRHDAKDWMAPVLLASATLPASITALSQAIDRHQAWLDTTEHARALREQRARYRLTRLLELRLSQIVAQQDSAFLAAPLEQQIALVLGLMSASSARK